MNNLNTVLIEGLLTRDPELGNAPAQVQMCRLSLANNRYFRGKEKWEQEASYFTVYVYGKVAGACLTYLKKGRGVRIVGRLKQLTWRTGGLQSEKIIILAEHIEFQPPKKTEQLKEAELAPGEFATRSSNLDELMEEHELAASNETPSQEPAAQIPDIIPADVPQCQMEDNENPETKADTNDEESFDDNLGEAV